MRWHHRLNGCEFEWTPGVGDGQGGLACCNSWGRRVGHDWVTGLNWTGGLLEIFLVSWGRTTSLWTSPLRTTLLNPIDLYDYVFISVYLEVFSDSFISLLTHWSVSSMLFSLHVFVVNFFFSVVFSHFSFCGWFLVSNHCGQNRCLK